MLPSLNLVSIFSVGTVIVHIVGIATAAHAVMVVRSSRGAIAWGISLVTFPWLAIPLYWILGNNEFQAYAEALQNAYQEQHELVRQAYGAILKHKATLPKQFSTLEKLAQIFSPLPFTTDNELELLIDGRQTYRAMLEAISQAEEYILLQSYIVRSDLTGDRFQQALIEKAQQGVRISLLYDKIGSRRLSRKFLKSLRQQGIEVKGFGSTTRKGNRFRINFRNHRKILIVDGKVAFMGGLNIGDEYLGENARFGSWRDTHLKLRGAAVQCLQSIFLGDWYWVTKEIPPVDWQVRPIQGDCTTLVLPTGPADKLDNCNLFFLSSIERSRVRLWIATPYFVPNSSVFNALKLAALRGVDVRLILPNRPDHLSVYLCSFSYYQELRDAGIKLYRYRSGFMHQKVILIDNDLAGLGTVNLDNRSFFLNFEVTTFSIARQFVGSIATMLQQDIEASRLVDLDGYRQKPFWFRLAARISRLLAPVL